MPIILGALASVLVGISDGLGRVGAKRANAFSVVVMSMVAGIGVTLVSSLVLGGNPSSKDWLAGAASGLFLSTGLAMNYMGMARSSAALVSPLAALLAAVVPLGWDVIGAGARPTNLAWLGCGIAVISLGFTTFNPDLGSRVKTGVLFGLAAGFLYGGAVTTIGITSEESGVWPTVLQRALGLVAVAIIARNLGAPKVFNSSVAKVGLLSGLAGSLGMVAFVIGAQRGELGEVAVASSMFPAVTTGLAKIFDDDYFRWWQGIGIAGAIAGTALIALG